MPSQTMTLAELAARNDALDLVGVIDETVRAYPELELGPGIDITGGSYHTFVRTGNPGVSFRNVNEGSDVTPGTWRQQLVETFVLTPPIEVDKAIARRHRDGQEGAMFDAAVGVLRGSMDSVCSQFYYGTTSDAKGFPGLLQSLNTDEMQVDATGTGSACTSVWAVKFGIQEVSWVWGQGGKLELSPVQEQLLTDSNGKKYPGLVQHLEAYPGLQVGTRYSVARIKNLSTAAGKTLNDDLLSQLVEKFETYSTGGPDLILMTARSRRQLQQSRTTYSPTGEPAPIPREYDGIPIRVTRSITNTETAS